MAHVSFTVPGRRLPAMRVPVALVQHTSERGIDLDNHLAVRRVVESMVSRMRVKLPLPDGQSYRVRPGGDVTPAEKRAGCETSQYSGRIIVCDDQTWDDVRTAMTWQVYM